MVTKSMEQKVAATRETGCFELDLSEEGFPLDKLLLFAGDMFPDSKHEDLRVMPAAEGKICIVTIKKPVSS